MSIIIKPNAGDKKICPICGEKLVRITSNKGKQYVKCSKNGFLEETTKATSCEFSIDLKPAIIAKNKNNELTDIEVIALLNGEKVKKGAGHFYIDGIPDIPKGSEKKYYVHFTFDEAVVEDF
ncbi:hypothetical protein ACOAK2_12250 (plasmid) [Aliarcobacter butzleri]|uniref:hypothetical protein n=1 Tax=Aliarcobacter butzleri TaxID=28197 RepID=UPI003B2854DB